MLSSHTKSMRWDGAARACSSWDNVRRDPELWFRNGNCLVHLYAKGQSRRGPAFKVPFAALLDARCHPLIERFIADTTPESPSSEPSNDKEHRRKSTHDKEIELYIPAPARANKTQAFAYHQATRNFFAWVFRRSMVGEHLGSALIGLLHSMHEFRSSDVDNVADLMGYLDEEGYLDMRNQPYHSIAMLHLAEYFQLRDLYIDAFAHCTGMGDRLSLSPEFELLSPVTRKLIGKKRTAMKQKLSECGGMLKTFLQDELSEMHLGLYTGARAHLERFRTLLHGFYATKFGYYPPPTVDSKGKIFEPETYRTMRDDFEALYEYLVDGKLTSSEESPFLAQGGICVYQNISSFDMRHRYESLLHPLPLLPSTPPKASPTSKRLSWFAGKPEKSVPDQRMVRHAALIKATNREKVHLLDNDLVRAYRRFEEDAIYSPLKADRQEKLGPTDARKVRWILIYAVLQTLRHATEIPKEVRDVDDVSYNLAISTSDLPPWKEQHPVGALVRRQTVLAKDGARRSTSWTSNAAASPAAMEIQPDIDYFTLMTQSSSPNSSKASTPAPEQPSTLLSLGYPMIPHRSGSLARSISRSSSKVRRSLYIFTNRSPPKELFQPQPRRSSYHEIVVKGYGNGMNDSNLVSVEEHEADPEQVHNQPPALKAFEVVEGTSEGSVSPRTSSSSSDDSRVDSSNSDETSLDSPATSTFSENSWGSIQIAPSEYDRSDEVAWCADIAGPGRAPRALSVYSRRGSTAASSVYSQDGIDQDDHSSCDGNCDHPADREDALLPTPLRIRKRTSCIEFGEPPVKISTSEYLDDIKPEWEQFNDLGGHTELMA